ncbi:MAG: hypothetical protein WD045_10800 [Pirellulaceae bacterium]
MEIAELYEQTITGLAVGSSPLQTRLRISGETHVRFIQGLCSGDVKTLAPGQACEAFFPTVQGKILAHGFLLRRAEAIEFLGWGDQREALLGHLNKYGIVEDVEIEDLSGEVGEILLAGSQAIAALETTLSPTPRAEPLTHQSVTWRESTLQVFRCPVFAFPTFSVSGPKDVLAALAAELDRQSFVVQATAALWETLRIENRFPAHGIDISAENLGQEANRNDQAIHFQKGCYLGQETIARIDAMGHVNRKLMPVAIAADKIPPLPAEIENPEGKSLGRITSACWSPHHKGIVGLAMLRQGANASGIVLDTQWGDVTVG